jgi:hypothetical protein
MFLLPAAARADGLTVVGHYVGSDGVSFLNISTFVEGDETVAVLNISQKVSITFGKQEWQSLDDLWLKAKQTNSTSFQFCGAFKETGTTYNSLLMMAAGPGALFVINDSGGTYVFVLNASDYAAFDADVNKVAQTLSASVK